MPMDQDYFWWCPDCQVRLEPVDVTYEETHDGRRGGCGGSVVCTTATDVTGHAIPRSEVQWFAEQMEVKLRANDHKGGWRDESLFYFVNRIADEWRELNHTVDLATMHEVSPQDIIAECADIANFAMMLADVVKQKGV